MAEREPDFMCLVCHCGADVFSANSHTNPAVVRCRCCGVERKLIKEVMPTINDPLDPHLTGQIEKIRDEIAAEGGPPFASQAFRDAFQGVDRLFMWYDREPMRAFHVARLAEQDRG